MDTSQLTNMSPEQLVVSIGLAILILIAEWKVFTKANRPGWAVLIPIYNTYVLLKIVGRPWYWLLLLLIPIVNIFIYITVMYNLAQSFGKGVGFTLLLIFFPYIALLILGYGKSTYEGPVALRSS